MNDEKDSYQDTYSSEDAINVIVEGPGDNTIRPRRPDKYNPREWPPPPKPAGDQTPPADGST
jgi:hypothetical protein